MADAKEKKTDAVETGPSETVSFKIKGPDGSEFPGRCGVNMPFEDAFQEYAGSAGAPASATPCFRVTCRRT